MPVFFFFASGITEFTLRITYKNVGGNLIKGLNGFNITNNRNSSCTLEDISLSRSIWCPLLRNFIIEESKEHYYKGVELIRVYHRHQGQHSTEVECHIIIASYFRLIVGKGCLVYRIVLQSVVELLLGRLILSSYNPRCQLLHPSSDEVISN